MDPLTNKGLIRGGPIMNVYNDVTDFEISGFYINAKI